jgi:hypothetical protein
MKMYVPSIGDRLRLIADFEFACFFESRNRDFLKRVRPEVEQTGWLSSGESVMITIPKGVMLTVSRIYIRNGLKDFDSITFFAKKDLKVWPHHGRFWAKLYDNNEGLEFEKMET